MNPEILKLVESGEHWKAKEKLQGKLATPGFDATLFEEYGFVLLEMNDKLEAGKYLFLSGVRKVEYLESITLYLERYSGTYPQALFHTFPKKAQKSDISEYPSVVREELSSIGVTHKKLEQAIDHRQRKHTLKDRAYQAGCVGIFVVILFAFGAGVINGFGLIFSLIFGRT